MKIPDTQPETMQKLGNASYWAFAMMAGMPFILIICWIALLPNQSVAQNQTKELAATSPKLSLLVFFERQNVRERARVHVELLTSNESDYELTNATLAAAGPSFFKWYVDSCNGKNYAPDLISESATISLGSIAVRSTLKCQLHLQTEPTIEVGDFNSLFILRYQWKTDQGLASSFVTSEKSLKVNFLGSENVAGIPLALAGFIVPGLVFWLVIKHFGAPWSMDALSDQMIYSVLISVVLVGAGTWIKYIDVSIGISVEKLIRLVVTGLMGGIVVGFIDLCYRKKREKRALEKQITYEDSDLTLLGKLVELPTHATLPQAIIRLKDGTEYIGALGARTEMIIRGHAERDIIYSLVGSFMVDLSKAENVQVRDKIERLQKEGRRRDLLTLANDHHLVEMTDSIQLIKGGGALEATGRGRMQWKDTDVAGITPNSEDWGNLPLVIK